MRKKQIYEAPEAEALLVRIEKYFCLSPLETNESYNPNNPMSGSFNEDGIN